MSNANNGPLVVGGQGRTSNNVRGSEQVLILLAVVIAAAVIVMLFYHLASQAVNSFGQ